MAFIIGYDDVDKSEQFCTAAATAAVAVYANGNGFSLFRPHKQQNGCEN